MARPWTSREDGGVASLKADFDRIMQLEFDSLISAHGSVIESGAKAAVARAISKAFPVSKSSSAPSNAVPSE